MLYEQPDCYHTSAEATTTTTQRWARTEARRSVNWQQHQFHWYLTNLTAHELSCTTGRAQGLSVLVTARKARIAGGSTEAHLNVLAEVLAASCVGANAAIYASL